MNGQAKPPIPDTLTFTLGSQEHRLKLHLIQPRISIERPRLCAETLRPSLLLQRQTLAPPRYFQQRFSFQPHTVTFQLHVPGWNGQELTTIIMARLRRRPATMPQLKVALFMSAPGSEEWLSRVLGTLIQDRRIAAYAPGWYFALPWERFSVPYTPRAFALKGYLSLASEFWKSRNVQPTPEQEPDVTVRDFVARHLSLPKPRSQPPKSPAPQTYVTWRDMMAPPRRLDDFPPSEDAKAAKQELQDRRTRVMERLVSLREKNPWLVTPAGTQYISILGTHFRIDASMLPEGKLWMYWQPDGQQVSAAVKTGQVFTKSAGGGWTALRSQAELTRHFHEARLAKSMGYLQAYALGEEVLQALPMS